MGWNDHIDPQLTEAVKELVAGGFVFEGGVPFDIAQKIIARGKESLTEAELQVFEGEIVPALRALDEAKAEDQINEQRDATDP
jgi:hypothetical protein